MSENVLESMRAAVAALPDDIALRLHLADLLLVGGETAGAVQNAAVVLEHDPGNEAALLLMARALGKAPSPRRPKVETAPANGHDADPADAKPDDDAVAAKAPEPPPKPTSLDSYDWDAAEIREIRELIGRLWVWLTVAHVLLAIGFVYTRFTGGAPTLRIAAGAALLAAIGVGVWRFTRPHVTRVPGVLAEAVHCDPPAMSGVVTGAAAALLLAVAICTVGTWEICAEVAGGVAVLVGLVLLFALTSVNRLPE